MSEELWSPRTTLGKKVANGEIKTLSQALQSKLPLKEYQVVDMLLPTVKDEVLNMTRAQRMTDSGRRM
ncbi:30S ribosomal protein S5P, partial [mine drainage metagenome]